MKIRNGFVSNSSSSSYLIYGFPVEEAEELQSKLTSCDEIEAYDTDTEYLEDESNYSEIDNSELEDFIWDHRTVNDDGDIDVFGITLGRWDYYEDNIDINLEQLDKEKKALCKATKEKLGVDISSEDFRFIGVHIPC